MSARSTSLSPGRSPARSVSRSPGRSPARRLEETDETQLERLYKPVFVMKPSSFKCSEGQTARFDLKVVGRPMPDTFWFHNAANRLRMVNEFGYCGLDYEVAYARDSGVITCRATNKFGVDQTSATLIVKDEKTGGSILSGERRGNLDEERSAHLGYR
ncbi:titin-like [Astyanax mexicanus]|uniref:Titin n=2 Tax=Astyanax mexicanus TaxID=7994 RepID=A0A3B1IXI7_ASTMX|nr:titin-like [Astyanax mexicanus]